ncbi:MAG: hypothetical protein AB8G23_23750 [Myxococcota bacterium]
MFHWVGFAVIAAIAFAGTSAQSFDFPPSPYDILNSRDLETPLLDGPAFCVPDGLDAALDPILEQAQSEEWGIARRQLAEWAAGLDTPGPRLMVLDAVFDARRASEREAHLAAEDRLRTMLRVPQTKGHRLCLRMELARTLLQLSRISEAAAQLTRADRILDDLGVESLRREEIAFQRAEILYARGLRFDAHLAYRKLARAESARLALAARLRLTDLSFDAGKVSKVSLEYEALLPRAAAFGASNRGWALRASEAALDAQDASGALRWLESFLADGPLRDARDAAEIRLADLDLALDDPMGARERLSGVSGRHRSDPIGAVAAIRMVDLGVSAGSPDQRLASVLKAVREQRDGVRTYALTVLMKELSHRGDLEAALAVATRLAYDGVDGVISPEYDETLDALLSRVTARADGPEGCNELVRSIGGRYGILMERAKRAKPFARVGECFEQLELPWLAAKVYRSVTRRFGAGGAQAIALPLARVSIPIGEVTLARRVATAALEDPGEDEAAWKAIVAEADVIDGRYAEAALGLRAVLDSPSLEKERGKLISLLSQTLSHNKDIVDAEFIAARVPKWLSTQAFQPGAKARMIEAAILSAHVLRKAGKTAQATALYRIIDEKAEGGSIRSSARFWLGMAGEGNSEGEPAWGDEPELELGTPWDRVALFEEHSAGLFSSYGGGGR